MNVLLNPTAKAFTTLRQDFSLQRLLADYADVSSPNILIRAFVSWVMSVLSFLLFTVDQLPKRIASNFLRPKWHVERADVPQAFLKGSRQVLNQRGLYAPSQFRPRWLIKVTYHQSPTTQVDYELHVVECDNEAEANNIKEKGYIALSYAFKNAKELFLEANPRILEHDIPPEPHAPLTTSDRLMTAWVQVNATNGQTQKRWRDVAVRQRVAM
ncbi:12846_t:CDS:1, partial [Acaulospora colombiana]